jgi:hypothetical protein
MFASVRVSLRIADLEQQVGPSGAPPHLLLFGVPVVIAAKSTDYLVTASLERLGYGGLTWPLTCIFVVFTAITTGTPATTV